MMKLDYKLIIGLLIVAIGGYIIYSSNRDSTKATVKKDGDKTREQLDGQDEKLNIILERLGPDHQKADELLRQLFGNNYREILRDEETFKSLKDLLQEKSFNEILQEKRLIENRLRQSEILKKLNAVALIESFISVLKYDSARIVIDKFIEQNPNLEPKFLAELYAFKAMTYTGKDLDHDKRKEYILKALDLDRKNPDILQFYAHYLSYNEDFDGSIEILENLLRFHKDGLAINNLVLTKVYIRLGYSLFKKEIRKSKPKRNLERARSYIDSAKAKNSTLSPRLSRLHVIKRIMAQFDMEEGDFDGAITLLDDALNIGNEIKKDKDYVTLNNDAFSNMYLGICYTRKYFSEKKELQYSKAVSSFLEALSLFKSISNDQNTNVGSVYGNLASLEMYRNTDKAIEYLIQAKKIGESYQIKHPKELGLIYSDLGKAYYLKGELNEAKTYLYKGLNEFRKVLSEEHEDIKIVKHNIAVLEGN